MAMVPNLTTTSRNWMIPRPSQRPIAPPTSDMKKKGLNFTKSVEVVVTVSPKTISMIISFSNLSVRSLVVMLVVLQGKGQLDTWPPSNRGTKAACMSKPVALSHITSDTFEKLVA